jgi:hypothetical protein
LDGKPVNFDRLAEMIRAAQKEEDRIWEQEFGTPSKSIVD